MTLARSLLAVVPPHLGGRAVGAGRATLFPEQAHLARRTTARDMAVVRACRRRPSP